METWEHKSRRTLTVNVHGFNYRGKRSLLKLIWLLFISIYLLISREPKWNTVTAAAEMMPTTNNFNITKDFHWFHSGTSHPTASRARNVQCLLTTARHTVWQDKIFQMLIVKLWQGFAIQSLFDPLVSRDTNNMTFMNINIVLMFCFYCLRKISFLN